MNRTKDTDVKSNEPPKSAERRFQAQDEPPPDPGGESKSQGTLPAMGDDEE